ncbi:MAG: CARDB domain-containing protein [Tepidisphaeraceae bacterium]
MRHLEPLESRQLRAADLIVTAFTIDQGVNPTRPGTTHVLSGSVTVKNTGNSTATGSALVYICIEDEPRSADTNRWTLNNNNWVFNLGAGKTQTFTWSGTVNIHDWDNDDNATYISAWVDSNGGVAESNEDNNRYRQEGEDWHLAHYDDNLKYLPSNDPVVAWNLPYEFSTTGTIGDEMARGADIDTYAVDLPGGKTYELGVLSSAFDANLRVYDANWNLVAQNDNHPEAANPNDPFVRVTVGMTTRYYMVVASAYNANADPRSLQGRYWGPEGTYTVYNWAYTYPTVSLKPADGASNVANEGTAAGFWLERTGRTDRAITVKWDVLGSAANNADIQLGDGSAANYTSYTIPIGVSRVWVPIQAKQDNDFTEGLENVYIELRYKDEYIQGSPNFFNLYIQEDPNLVGPRVTSKAFIWSDAAKQRLYYSFDQQIVGFDASDITVTNLTTGQVVGAGQKRGLTGPSGDTAILFFDAGLANGNYRATFNAGTITNPQGRSNQTASNVDFFVLAGDANHDRTVNFSDLLALASNYGKSGYPIDYTQGDFNYDSTVNFSDLLVLAASYGQSLAAPPPLLAATSAPSSGTRFWSEEPIERDASILA